MTTTKGVETSVTTTNTNSPSQDYTNLDDQLLQTCNDTPGFEPFTLSDKAHFPLMHFVAAGEKFRDRKLYSS